MAACEKCWADAYTGTMSQVERYEQLLKERKDKPCPACQMSGACPSSGHGKDCTLSWSREEKLQHLLWQVDVWFDLYEKRRGGFYSDGDLLTPHLRRAVRENGKRRDG